MSEVSCPVRRLIFLRGLTSDRNRGSAQISKNKHGSHENSRLVVRCMPGGHFPTTLFHVRFVEPVYCFKRIQANIIKKDAKLSKTPKPSVGDMAPLSYFVSACGNKHRTSLCLFKYKPYKKLLRHPYEKRIPNYL